MLVQVLTAIIAMTALSAFVVDYGILWSARRQAQNAADSAALAAAVSLGFVDFNNRPLARTAALDVAARNAIWGEPPDVTPGDVTFPPCPPGSLAPGTNACVQVDVFRNQRGGGNPLPTMFGHLAGVTEQGVRATATAEVLFGLATNCVKPFAIPDRWIENQTPVWDVNDSFSRYFQVGPNAGTVIPNPDVFVPPTTTSPGSGFDPIANYGLQLTIKDGNPNSAIQPGWYYPVIINPNEPPGGDSYRENIATCDPTLVQAGTVLTMEPGNMIGPTRQGMTDLINLDPTASWGVRPDGTTGVRGGCQASGACNVSPRVVAIPVFNPDTWDLGPSNGRSSVTVTQVVGMFVEQMVGNDVVGRLMPFPNEPRSGTGGVPGAGFVVSVTLVR